MLHQQSLAELAAMPLQALLAAASPRQKVIEVGEDGVQRLLWQGHAGSAAEQQVAWDGITACWTNVEEPGKEEVLAGWCAGPMASWGW